MQDTSKQYDAVINECRSLFIKKMSDYGSAWRILRLPSLTDQIFIKAQRIRQLQENEVRKVDEGEKSEFIGIINYSIMALIQLELGVVDNPDLTTEQAALLYDKHSKITKELMLNKNHDYGEAWRDMRVSSFTDLILMKLLRMIVVIQALKLVPRLNRSLFLNALHNVSCIKSCALNWFLVNFIAKANNKLSNGWYWVLNSLAVIYTMLLRM